MAAHDAEYFRNRRRAQGIEERVNYDRSPHVLAAAEELRALMAAPLELREREDLCPCGCKQTHRQRVTQTIRSVYGQGWHVLYFSSDSCKSKFNRARVAH